MALSNTTNSVSGVRGMGTRCATAHTSINAYSAMGSGMENNNAASLTRGVKPDESAGSPTTTPGWPILTAPQMSGPSDDKKDVNKGVMS
jgi:hypothetical protein